MMQGPTGWILTLSCAYVALAALALWALLASRASLLVKGAMALGAPAFYLAVFFGLRALPGYASEERLPPRFKLLSARVVEPKTIPGDPGSIYIWVEPMDENDVLSGRPRAYRLPYLDKQADDVVNALKKSNEGHPQAGRTTNPKDNSDWLGPNAGLTIENGASAEGRDPTADARSDDGVEFTPLAGPRLPTKDDQFTP